VKKHVSDVLIKSPISPGYTTEIDCIFVEQVHYWVCGGIIRGPAAVMYFSALQVHCSCHFCGERNLLTIHDLGLSTSRQHYSHRPVIPQIFTVTVEQACETMAPRLPCHVLRSLSFAGPSVLKHHRAAIFKGQRYAWS
jgi:hypothetical protein